MTRWLVQCFHREPTFLARVVPKLTSGSIAKIVPKIYLLTVVKLGCGAILYVWPIRSITVGAKYPIEY
jgi:hypothetical protein